jgi:hypothetical protein
LAGQRDDLADQSDLADAHLLAAADAGQVDGDDAGPLMSRTAPMRCLCHAVWPRSAAEEVAGVEAARQQPLQDHLLDARAAAPAALEGVVDADAPSSLVTSTPPRVSMGSSSSAPACPRQGAASTSAQCAPAGAGRGLLAAPAALTRSISRRRRDEADQGLEVGILVLT